MMEPDKEWLVIDNDRLQKKVGKLRSRVAELEEALDTIAHRIAASSNAKMVAIKALKGAKDV